MTPQLDLQQLRMFHVLALAGSFTATAKRLLRTQSAVSHAIRKLETSAGLKLIDRHSSPLLLTEAGQRLFKACEVMFTALEDAMEDIAQQQGSSLGCLRIGATVEFGCSILMKHMKPFLDEHPNLSVEFTMSNDLLGALQRDELDIIIDCGTYHDEELDRRPLFRETYTIVASPAYQIQMALEVIEDLSRATLLSFDREGTWWNRFLTALPAEERLELRRILPINHIRGMIVAAKHGIGVALVPQYSVLSELSDGRLVGLFTHLNLSEDRFSIYQKHSRKTLRRHQLLVDYLLGVKPWEFAP